MVLREASEESVLLGLFQLQQIQLLGVDAVLLPEFLEIRLNIGTKNQNRSTMQNSTCK
jgi:hypothetical protein